MNITRNFTRGGQISLHWVRMIGQVFRTTCMFAMLGSLVGFIVLTYVNTHPYHYYLVRISAHAHYDLNLGGDKKAQPRKIELAKGGTVFMTPKQIINHPSIQRQLIQLQNRIQQNVVLSLYGFISLFCILIGLFIWKGRLHLEHKQKRGGQIATPQQVKRAMQSLKICSDLHLDALPLVKGKETSHMLITGTTGAGKSNCFHTLLPQIRARGERAIVVDLTGDMVARYYREGIDVILNPFDERSAKWCLWQECQSPAEQDSFATAVVPDTNPMQDSFWKDAGRVVLTTAIQKLLSHQSSSLETLLDKLIKVSLKQFHDFFAGTDAAPFTDKEGEKTTNSIRATLAAQLTSFKHLADVQQGFTLRDWVYNEEAHHQQWVFLTARADQRATLKPLITAWVDLSINALMTLPPDPKRRLWYILDELPALQRLPSLEQGLAELRKYGGCILAGIQNVPQLTTVYGASTAQTLLDLFNTYVFFRSSDPHTTRWISQVLGESEATEMIENVSYGAHAYRDGISLAPQTRTKPLVMPTEIAQLNDLQCYIKLPGSIPITHITMQYKVAPIQALPFVLFEHSSNQESTQITSMHVRLECEVD